MKKIFLTLVMVVLFHGVCSATPSVENTSLNGDWGRVDVNPVSLYAHTGTNAIAPLKIGVDGSVSVNSSVMSYAMKIQEPDSTHTYIGIAPVGTAQSSAEWQAKLITTSGTSTTITWADGNANFDNVATDLSSLTYN